MSGPPCPDCGTENLVTVVSETDGGDAELRRYCQECDRRRAKQERDKLRPFAQSLARLLVNGGILLALLSSTVDHLAISDRPGLGWHQLVGAELGFLAIVLGLFLRKGLLGTAGAFLLALSVAADVLKVGHSPELGWRTHVGLLCGLAMIAAGITWRRALARGEGLSLLPSTAPEGPRHPAGPTE